MLVSSDIRQTAPGHHQPHTSPGGWDCRIADREGRNRRKNPRNLPIYKPQVSCVACPRNQLALSDQIVTLGGKSDGRGSRGLNLRFSSTPSVDAVLDDRNYYCWNVTIHNSLRTSTNEQN